MQVRPLTVDALADTVTERTAQLAPPEGGRLRIAVDGAPAARTAALADAVADRLRLLGRPAQRISAEDFLRPASLRLEYGHQDPDAYYDGWLDANALFREVFDPLEPGGSGLVLPALRDARSDRAVRAAPVALPPGGVLVLDGPLLLGRWFPLDLAVHLHLSPAALARRTAPEEQWTLPAFARYEQETRPGEAADLVVRADDPRRPALVID
ncbi:uridine kinase [Streptacidiphilus sp. PB12-B1b]|uniref:uridine kinase n=1 Tax=Streptacidiphilus sp. PB12-B1b TaxID=2705012 RepID=UPI0015F88655|nr:uridine kinase [Streptacidiphilus sp. PB12-B1b]QMU74533.1 uridine kinase [Streptacidiphilus sp. PB12-B1b]